MEDRKDWLDPDKLTPEERREAIIDLLAVASVRLALKEKGMGPRPAPERPRTSISAVRGRVPFGQKRTTKGRAPDEKEAALICRIEELVAQECSLVRIAAVLNKEDRESRRAGKWSGTAVWRILRRIKPRGVTD